MSPLDRLSVVIDGLASQWREDTHAATVELQVQLIEEMSATAGKPGIGRTARAAINRETGSDVWLHYTADADGFTDMIDSDDLRCLARHLRNEVNSMILCEEYFEGQRGAAE